MMKNAARRAHAEPDRRRSLYEIFRHVRRRAVVVAVSLLLGCGGTRHGEPPAVPVTIARTGPAPPVTVVPTPAPALVRGPAEPLLVATLGKGRAAILLSNEWPKGDGPVTVLEPDPILSIARSVAPDKLPPEARARIEERYSLGIVGGKSCIASKEDVAVLSRIVADDPTAGRAPAETDRDYAKRMFDQGEHSSVVIVRLAPECGGPLYAVPEGSPLPRVLEKASAPPVAVVEGAVRRTSGVPLGKRPITTFAFGPSFAWAYVAGQDAFAFADCFLLKRAEAKVNVVATMAGCPSYVEAMTEDARGELVVWFGHGRAKLVGTDLDLQFFPTASYAPAGGI